MNDNGHGRSLQRARSSSDASSVKKSRKPEKLCDMARIIRPVGRAFVDDGEAMSPTLAAVVSQKAFKLRIKAKNRESGESETFVGQAGLIRGDRLTPSPPTKRPAIGGGDRPAPSIRSSHFKASPTTALHNVVTEANSRGDMLDFQSAEIVAPAGNEMNILDFSKAGYEPSPDDVFVIRPGDDHKDGRIEWEYGHDVDSTAGEIAYPASHFTKKECTFVKMERPDYRFQVSQKIGVAIYRDFVILPEDTGMPNISEEELQRIYGPINKVNIYTGKITRVCDGGECFEHDINTFSGCSGAIVFLLDRNQDNVPEQDYGKAIAVHVGGDEVGAIVSNFAFKIPS